jgi:hypothetical protein
LVLLFGSDLVVSSALICSFPKTKIVPAQK